MAYAKNTAGAITKAVANQTATHAQTPGQVLNKLLNNGTIQETLKNTLGENSGAFTTSILTLFNGDPNLQQCDPSAIIKEAMKASALKLPIEKSLGLAYIIPYKDHGTMVPQFQLGYKGMIQLCMRSGVYKFLNAGPVYEGEFQGRNKLTGEIDINGEKTSEKIVGYFAYIETKNGFCKAEYWTRDEVIKHASRFSKSYKYGGVWSSDFDAMAIKTVTKSLLSKYGVMSVEIMQAFTEETGDTDFEADAPAMDETTIIVEGSETNADNETNAEQEAKVEG